MKITDIFSHKKGHEIIRENYHIELKEIYDAVENINLSKCLSKISYENSKDSLLFSPTNLNYQLKKYLFERGWTKPNPKSKKGFKEPRIKLGGNEFREMDGIKNKVGLEIQFGKYAFMGYDIFSKMPIFKNRGLIECGIELVVTNFMIKNMSTGVSSFNQIKVDMQERGEADIDIPTLILGFECSKEEWREVDRIRKKFNFAMDEKTKQGKIESSKSLAKLPPEKRQELIQEINHEYNLDIDSGFKGNMPGPK